MTHSPHCPRRIAAALACVGLAAAAAAAALPALGAPRQEAPRLVVFEAFMTAG
jgi:hypothetical protein